MLGLIIFWGIFGCVLWAVVDSRVGHCSLKDYGDLKHRNLFFVAVGPFVWLGYGVKKLGEWIIGED